MKLALNIIIHHFAFCSSDIEGDIIELEKNGCTRLADKAEIGLRGKKILFYRDSSLHIPIELSE